MKENIFFHENNLQEEFFQGGEGCLLGWFHSYFECMIDSHLSRKS